MKHLAPACFRAFACAAGSCPDSCCRAGWEIVPDGETLALYQTLPGETGARIRAGIVPPVGAAIGRPPEADASDELLPRRGGPCPPLPTEPLLRQNASRVCVLLDPDGLCCVQKHFGHGALCRVCRDYPRFRRDFGGLTEHGLSLSCPTAYALATSAPPAWEEWEDEAPPVPNELDPEAYLRLRKGRSLALELLAKEDLPFWRRLALVRRLAAAMEAAPERRIKHNYELRLRRWTTLPHRRDRSCPRSGTSDPLRRRRRTTHADRSLSCLSAPCGRPSQSSRRDKPRLSGLRSKQSPGGRSRSSAALCPAANAFVPNAGQARLVPTALSKAAALARRFLTLEILSPAWKDALERFLALAEAELTAERHPCAGVLPTPPDPEPYARWLWYELYKYWLDALDDGKLLARVDRALDMLLLGLAMDQALPGEGPFLRRISREIEHCEENLAALLHEKTPLR